jgi:CHAT domain-containing protein
LGQNSLEYGPVEVAAIAALFPKQQLLCEDAATRAAVLTALDEKTHIHFSFLEYIVPEMGKAEEY